MRAVVVTAAIVCLAGCNSNHGKEETKTVAPVESSAGSVVRNDPALDALIPQNAAIEKLAGGFQFIEGPLWRGDDRLWFSDVTGNVVREWSPRGVVEILRPGGFDGSGAPAGAFIGPNGMVAGKDDTVLLCQHGNRRIVTISSDRKISTLVDKFEGKRFNSPNDLVYKSDGSLYFTDPPYGLTGGDQDPQKDLPFNGVYRYAGGKLQVLARTSLVRTESHFHLTKRCYTLPIRMKSEKSGCDTTFRTMAQSPTVRCSRTSPPTRRKVFPTE